MTSSPDEGTSAAVRVTARRALRLALAGIVLAASPAAIAAWSAAGSGVGWAGAVAIGTGNAPSATVSGTTVDLAWSASTLSNGDPVSGYVVKRYDSTGTSQQVIASGSCATTVSGTTCSETAAPAGTWQYSVTPTHEGWVGAEGAKTVVVVGSPSLLLSPQVIKSGTTLTGTIENFSAGETLRFRLDSTSGAELAGTVDGAPTPAPVPLSGSAAVTVDVPAGTAEGAHSIHAVVDLSGQSASATVTVDDTPPPVPTITSGPSDPTAATSAEFHFTNSEAGVSFECRLDAGAYTTCSSPTSYASLSDGTHTFDVRARDAGGNASDPASFSWTIDTDAPAVAIAFPASGGSYGATTWADGCGTSAGDVCGSAGSGAADVRVSIRQGSGNYWDGSGFSSATEVLFTATGTGSWSLAFAASNFPSDGSYTVRAVARDAAGNSSSVTASFTIDRTAPAGADVQTANASGGTAGKAETGDTITFTYSEPLDPASILAGWDGSATSVVVRIYHRATLLLVPLNDELEVWNAANSERLPLGSVNLGTTDYVSADVTFGATGTPATMVQNGASITIALGSPSSSGAVTTALLAGSMSWTPSSTARDLAGNNSLTASVTESGGSDREF